MRSNQDDMRGKKVRVCEESGSGVKKRRVLWVKEASSSKEPWGKEASSSDDDVEKEFKLDFDIRLDDDEIQEDLYKLDILATACEIIHNISNESEDEDVTLVDMKGKQIMKGNFYETPERLSLGLRTLEGERDVVKSREDKWKAMVGHPWLVELIQRERREHELRFLEEMKRKQEEMDRNRKLWAMESRAKYHEDLRKSAVKFARDNSKKEDQSEEVLRQEEMEGDKQLGSTISHFSAALKMVRNRNLVHKKTSLIEWRPLKDNDQKCIAPSLLELSSNVLAQNAMAIISLDGVPDSLRRRIVDFLCNQRSMNSRILDLLLEGSPTAIRIKDCHWLPEDQFPTAFGNFDMKNLRVLQLDLCGQVAFEYALRETFGRSTNSLPNLGIISLKGAARLSDDAVKILVRSAPSLRSINLSQCTLVTEIGINDIADSLGETLRELYIDECPKLDAMLIVPALMKFKHLEVLSVAGVQSVCDQFVNDVVSVNLKELNLADCLKLTNRSLKLIGSTCVDLRALNISNLDQLTDVGIEYLANNCRSIETFKLLGNRFSDEAIAAFLEVSGKSMKELSLNKVSKVGHNTAISLAKCSRKLISLDLSWCRRISNEALGLIVDCCLSLRLLKLFGCSQINQVFLDGHSNSLVQIVGLRNTRLLDNVNILEPEEVLLRYSPL